MSQNLKELGSCSVLLPRAGSLCKAELILPPSYSFPSLLALWEAKVGFQVCGYTHGCSVCGTTGHRPSGAAGMGTCRG